MFKISVLIQFTQGFQRSERKLSQKMRKFSIVFYKQLFAKWIKRKNAKSMRFLFRIFYTRNFCICFFAFFCENIAFLISLRISHFFAKQIIAKFGVKSENFRIFLEPTKCFSIGFIFLYVNLSNCKKVSNNYAGTFLII